MNTKHQNNFDSLKCVWMTSNVVQYKLCDNEFNCENCSFDKSLRNLLSNSECKNNLAGDFIKNLKDKLTCIEYDNKLIYLKNNLVVKEICLDTYYLGVNTVLNTFLDNSSSITVSATNKNINKGKELLKISGLWGELTISSPMDIFVYDKAADSNNNSIRNQWFAIVGVENQQLISNKLSIDSWNDNLKNAFSVIEKLKSIIPSVGETMHDGGSNIKSLLQYIGTKEYLEILNIFVSSK